ncbi:MAG: LPXTG cell wall anchor domain-containing protein [Bacteroidota bacterium]
MSRKLLLVLVLLFSVAGFSRQEQSPGKFKKRSAASDSFRSKVKALADSIQKNKASFDSGIIKEKVQPVAEPETKKEKNSWLLPAAGIAVLAAFFFLFRRKRI